MIISSPCLIYLSPKEKAMEFIDKSLSEEWDSREAIEAEFTVNEHGIIQDPGKFEGEMVYVPYFYDMVMNGFSDESGEGWDAFQISAEDAQMFPELKDDVGKYMVIEYSDQGFVSGTVSDEVPEDEYSDDEEGY
jgi:hypothetical protein